MELLDRYLQAVRFWLPKKQRDDIIAELSEDIRSEVDEKESILGRTLSEAELVEILKSRGQPLTVAQHFLPQRYLIGPQIFPVYGMILRGLILYFWLPWLIIWLCYAPFIPAAWVHRPFTAWLTSLMPVWTFGLNGIVALTIAFAVIERCKLVDLCGASWDPRHLPAVRDPNHIPRSASIGEFGWNLFLLLMWVGALRLPEFPNFHVALAPVLLEHFYWPVAALLTATTLIALVNFISPAWTRSRAAIRLAIDAFGLSLIAATVFLPWTGDPVIIAAPELAPQSVIDAQRWFTFSLGILLLIATATYAARAIQDLRRTLGSKPIQNWAMRVFTGE